MTYNFDPDQWLENQLRALRHRLDAGEIDASGFREQSLELDRRHEEMLERLDGTYDISGVSSVTQPDRSPR